MRNHWAVNAVSPADARLMVALWGLYERLTSLTAWQTLSRRAAPGRSKQTADLKVSFLHPRGVGRRERRLLMGKRTQITPPSLLEKSCGATRDLIAAALRCRQN